MSLKLDPRRIGGQAAQLGFWESFETTRTNMVALYDVAPRFVYYCSEDVEKRKVIEREFTFGGQRFRVTLKPTPVKQADGSVRDCYLGEREQIVEEVIRRLASNRGRLTLHGESSKMSVRFSFFLNEVRRELGRIQHTYRLDEIRQAIMLLNEVRIRIEALDNKRSPILSAAAFPIMGMRKGEDDSEDRESFVEFNPLVSEAIRTLDFQQVSYDLLMEIRDPVARWLLKRLWIEMSEHDDPINQMTATAIWRDSGMPEWKATRNMLVRVKRAVENLRSRDILCDVEELVHKHGQRKDDITFTMTTSSWMLAQVRRSRKLAHENLSDFRKISGGRDPNEFLVVNGSDFQRIRDAQRRKVSRLNREVDEKLSIE